MPLTRDFKSTVQERASRDPAFRAGLFQEAVAAFLDDDIETGKILLRDFINATIGFSQLGREVGIPDKSLMRMVGPTGNPTAANLMGVIAHLKKHAKLDVSVQAVPARSRTRQRPELAQA